MWSLAKMGYRNKTLVTVMIINEFRILTVSIKHLSDIQFRLKDTFLYDFHGERLVNELGGGSDHTPRNST